LADRLNDFIIKSPAPSVKAGEEGASNSKFGFSFAKMRGVTRRARPEVARHPMKDGLREVARDLRARLRTNTEVKFRIAGRALGQARGVSICRKNE
jgi:hypothetical protein